MIKKGRKTKRQPLGKQRGVVCLGSPYHCHSLALAAICFCFNQLFFGDERARVELALCELELQMQQNGRESEGERASVFTET